DPRGQIDRDDVKDVAENVVITARDMAKDAVNLLVVAPVEGRVNDLVKTKEAYDKGNMIEAAGWWLGINGAVESLAQKDLAWQNAGASAQDTATAKERAALLLGEVIGTNDIMKAKSGYTEFDKELSTPERVMHLFQGGGKLAAATAFVAGGVSM